MAAKYFERTLIQTCLGSLLVSSRTVRPVATFTSLVCGCDPCLSDDDRICLHSVHTKPVDVQRSSGALAGDSR